MTAAAERVRPATMDDLEAILDRWVALIEHGREHGLHIEGAPNRPVARETLSAAISDGRAFVALDGPVAEAPTGRPAQEEADRSRPDRDPAVVGFCSLSVETGGFRRDAALGTVENLYVDPAHRGQGLGSALLAAGEAQLRDRGVEAVTVETMAADEDALAFYEAHGYAPHRRTVERSLEGTAEPGE